MNLDTPPSIDEDVALVCDIGVLACATLAEEMGRRKPSWPDFKFVSEAFLDTVSTGAGMAVADIDDIAGSALAECDGLKRRAAISPGSAWRAKSSV
jgi:hypothetical protein